MSFIFKRLRDMVLVSGQNEVLLVLLSFFLMLGNNACFKSSNCRWAPCSLTDSQIHGLIKTGRFFENPLVGRHVLIVRLKKGVNLSTDR